MSEKEKKNAAMLSILSNTSLIVLKFAVGIISGSISIISEALHSGSDWLASVITFFSVSESSKPADDEHPFGHGKYEDLSSLIEGILIILAAVYIVYASVKKLIFSPTIRIGVDLGLIVMFVSVIANTLVSIYLFKVAKRTDSAALYADGEHLRTDVYSSLAVLLGLLLVKITGNVIFDPLVAIVVAAIIFVAGYKICKKAQINLLDTSLSDEENSRIKDIVLGYKEKGVLSLKNLRTRKAGFKKNIEMTLIVERAMHISTAHELCDKIEDDIEERLENTDTTIHLEPNK